jgi:hypothetical protein
VSSPKQRPSVAQLPHPASFSTLYQLHQMQNGLLNGTVKHNGIFQRHHSQPEPYMWHAKSYGDGLGELPKNKINYSFNKFFPNKGDADFVDAAYPIYGRLPTPARGYVPVTPRRMGYVGDWE